MVSRLSGALGSICSQLEDQLGFYRELGVSDLGGSLPGNSEAAGKPVSSRTEPAADYSSDRSRDQEINLFRETVANPAKAPNIVSLFGTAMSDTSLESIREDIGDCRRCKLCEHRTNIVYGEGSSRARLMFIGEGPGADEDATGRPFVGRAGQLLDKIISAIGLRREDVYIANIVKCRPPENRAPERDEVAACEPFLFRQIAVIRPEVIVTLGSPALQCLLRSRDTITKARGEWREFNGIAVMPTFHPAYLLRSPDKKREVWEDMKKVQRHLSGIKS